MTWSEMQPASCRFTLKVSLQSFGLGLKAMGLASLGRKCNRHHAGFATRRKIKRHPEMGGIDYSAGCKTRKVSGRFTAPSEDDA